MLEKAERSARFNAFGILATHAPRGPDGNPVNNPKQKAILNRLFGVFDSCMDKPVIDTHPGTVQRLPLPTPPRRRSGLVESEITLQPSFARRLNVVSDEYGVDGDDDDDED